MNLDNLNIKCEDNGIVGIGSHTFNNQAPVSEDSELPTALNKAKARQRVNKKVLDDEDEVNDMDLNFKEEQGSDHDENQSEEA
jgi:hypothetical protein